MLSRFGYMNTRQSILKILQTALQIIDKIQ